LEWRLGEWIGVLREAGFRAVTRGSALGAARRRFGRWARRIYGRSKLFGSELESAGDVCIARETLGDVSVADESLPGGDPGG
jgi:hypothetical protein